MLLDISKLLIFSYLKQIIEELKSISCQANGISNLDGGPIYDCWLPQTSSWGPFRTISDFHMAFRNHVTLKSLEMQNHNPPSLAAILDVKQLVTFYESVIRLLVLRHSDLSSFDILIRYNTVVGIIN